MKLKWKKGLPAKPGWYWVRTLYDEEPRIVEVRLYVRNLAIGNSTLDGWTVMEKAKWAGPIPEPED